MSWRGGICYAVISLSLGAFSLLAQGHYTTYNPDTVTQAAGATAEDPAPDPTDFVAVEKEPQPLNYEEVRKRIGYPLLAKEAGIRGKVIVRVLVSKDGKYEKHIVLRSPHKMLTEAVERELPNLEFSPGIQAGKPVKVWVTTVFDFQLSEP